EADNRHLLLSKNIIAARYKRVSDDGISPARISTSITGGKIHIDDEASAGALGSKAVVVIGDVGVGKTSFFENLFEQLDQAEKAQAIYVHLNLGQKATLSK